VNSPGQGTSFGMCSVSSLSKNVPGIFIDLFYHLFHFELSPFSLLCLVNHAMINKGGGAKRRRTKSTILSGFLSIELTGKNQKKALF